MKLTSITKELCEALYTATEEDPYSSIYHKEFLWNEVNKKLDLLVEEILKACEDRKND